MESAPAFLPLLSSFLLDLLLDLLPLLDSPDSCLFLLLLLLDRDLLFLFSSPLLLLRLMLLLDLDLRDLESFLSREDDLLFLLLSTLRDLLPPSSLDLLLLLSPPSFLLDLLLDLDLLEAITSCNQY